MDVETTLCKLGNHCPRKHYQPIFRPDSQIQIPTYASNFRKFHRLNYNNQLGIAKSYVGAKWAKFQEKKDFCIEDRKVYEATRGLA